MAKKKNALRKHFIAEWTSDDTEPTEEDWLPLAHNIVTIEDDSDEDTEDSGDYAGDGSTETILNGRSEKWNFEGSYDAEDPAHKLLASMRRKVNDDDRKVWHKIIETNGDEVVGVAKAMEIKAGGGDATEYETFEGHLDYIKTPKTTPKAELEAKTDEAKVGESTVA